MMVMSRSDPLPCPLSILDTYRHPYFRTPGARESAVEYQTPLPPLFPSCG